MANGKRTFTVCWLLQALHNTRHNHPFTRTRNVALQYLARGCFDKQPGRPWESNQLPSCYWTTRWALHISVTLTSNVMELINNRSRHLWICWHFTAVIISHIFIVIRSYFNISASMSDQFCHQLSIRNETGPFSEISAWTHSQATVSVTVSSVFLHSAAVYLLPAFLTSPLCTLKCSVLTALSIGTWPVCWNLKTWLSVSSVVLHAGDTAHLSERCFSAICSGSRNRRVRRSSHDRRRIQRLRGLARLAFVALLLVFVVLSIGALVCVKRLELPAAASVFTLRGKRGTCPQ